MARIKKKIALTREKLEELLDKAGESLLRAYDNGKTEVHMRMSQSMADATKPEDCFLIREPGRTLKFEVTMVDPSDSRPEEWG